MYDWVIHYEFNSDIYEILFGFLVACLAVLNIIFQEIYFDYIFPTDMRCFIWKAIKYIHNNEIK